MNANFTVLSTIQLISGNNVLVLILTNWQLFKIVSNNFQLRVRHECRMRHYRDDDHREDSPHFNNGSLPNFETHPNPIFL